MDKKEIIILAFVFALIGIRIYQRYAKKKKGAVAGDTKTVNRKGGLAGQPDDYEPYSRQK